MSIQDLYQDLIVDHGTQPRNCCSLSHANGQAEGFNPLCGDKVQVYLNIQDNTIQEASFTGTGCAICMASASLMTETLIGKTKEVTLNLSHTFKNLLTSDTPHLTENLGKLAAFSGVKAFPARVKCATLPWHALEAAIKNAGSTLKGRILDVLKGIFDPEIPVNIYDLGLIYKLELDETIGAVNITMTLTTPACPVAQSFPQTVQDQVLRVPAVTSVVVELVWDPPWTQNRMTEAAKLQLNLL